ncbi:hypothetical protein LINGRAHAP2_LOCUS30094, partial [Linum grandiflorum]
RIGNYIGRTVRPDLAIEAGSRGRFTRLCVEVDLSKPLLGRYLIKDRLFYTEYESLDNICTHCGYYGHKVDKCPELVEEPITTPIMLDETMEDPADEGDVGAWMSVTRRNHRRRGKQEATTPNPDNGSRLRLLRRGDDENMIYPRNTEDIMSPRGCSNTTEPPNGKESNPTRSSSQNPENNHPRPRSHGEDSLETPGPVL